VTPFWICPLRHASAAPCPSISWSSPSDAPTTARLVLEALRRAWPALEGGIAPAFENAVLAGCAVLLRHRLPIVLLHDLFTDAPWRDTLLAAVTDPTVRGFFRRLDRWGAREQAQYLESTLRRAFLLGFSPVLRASLGQSENSLRWRERFDRGQSLIVNLALPDADARRLLGCFFTVFAEQAALQRADVAPGERGRGHTLILDEFADVASQSGTALTHILEQCRKFGLALVLANQTGGQLNERGESALANVGTSVVFRLGRADAEAAARRVGATDPWRVKHLVRDRGARQRMHPLYTSLAEQWEGWAQTIQRLKSRSVVVRRANGRVAMLTTPSLPDPVVDAERLAVVEQHFLATWFTPQPVVEEELAALRASVAPPAIQRRTRRRLP